jgi:hypothetical protein
VVFHRARGRLNAPACPKWSVVTPLGAVVVGTFGEITGAFVVPRRLVFGERGGSIARVVEQDRGGAGRRRGGAQRPGHTAAGDRVDGERGVADRCREDYVVEFLDSVHTLVRDAPRSHHTQDGKARTPGAYFVVAADGAWIRQSYSTAYQTFEQSVAASGGSLGYLFTDKLFQLNVPMPGLGSRTQREFLGALLGVGSPEVTAEARVASAAIERATGDEAAIVETLESLNPQVREAVAGTAALALASAETQQNTEHALRKFSPLLHGNPRSIKLFLNTYSVLRSIRTLEGGTVAPDTLALWSLIRVRWPSIADFLQHNPEAIEGIKDNLWCSDHFPDELQSAARDKELRNVVMHHCGGPLRPDLIRQCFGAAE